VGGQGNTNGTGASARFAGPYDIATDSAGNMYVADSSNEVIRKVTSSGVVTTFAGTVGINGSLDGTGTAARFNFPSGLAIDATGNIYVADEGNSTIRKITPAGVVSTFAGMAGHSTSVDGTGTGARFTDPTRIAIDNAGNLYVTDSFSNTIRRITPTAVVTTLTGSSGVAGSTDGNLTAALFKNPCGIAIDSAGNIYIADEGNNTIRKITPAGVVSTLAGVAGAFGSVDGTGTSARFNNLHGMTIDSAGNLYVTDSLNNIVRKVTSAGVVTTLAGTAGTYGSADGTGATAYFSQPFGITADSGGNLYVADTGNNTIRKITSAAAVTTLAGIAAISGSTDGTGQAARFDIPFGLATDNMGNLYIADTYNHIIRKSTAAGVVTTLAGSVNNGAGSSDGTGTMASFDLPYGVATDSAGNVYVADTFNSTIRKISSTGVVSTLAGMAGNTGTTDGTGATARFNRPRSIALDTAGNVYVADTDNHTIRKVTSAGVVTTLAGRAGSTGNIDGTGTSAFFNTPQGIAVDGNNNIYVADTNNQEIRKITAGGAVTTLAGSSSAGSVDGMGSAARFNFPHGVTIDASGNIYVADTSNQLIRKITPAGLVTTIAGVTGMEGFLPGPLPGVIADPVSIAISGKFLYFLNHGNGVGVITNFP